MATKLKPEVQELACDYARREMNEADIQTANCERHIRYPSKDWDAHIMDSLRARLLINLEKQKLFARLMGKFCGGQDDRSQ